MVQSSRMHPLSLILGLRGIKCPKAVSKATFLEIRRWITLSRNVSIFCWTLLLLLHCYSFAIFLTLGYTPTRFLVITLVCPFVVCGWGRDSPIVFSNFLHRVKATLGYKRDRAQYLKKILRGSDWGKYFRGIFKDFYPYLYLSSHCNFLNFYIWAKLNIS